jgi:hypothetical protein
MYYKLPIKDRMDLMKSYKKANPKMSYSDMVNDYNDTYQKFGNGGIKDGDKNKEPIKKIETTETPIKEFNLPEVDVFGYIEPERIKNQKEVIQKNNPKNNYGIIDKKDNKIYYYNPQGKLILSENVITGKSNNDVDQGLSMKDWFKKTGSTNHEDYFKYLEQNKYQTTPSGVFNISGVKEDVATDPNKLGRFINFFRPERAKEIRDSRIRDYGEGQKMLTLKSEYGIGSSKAMHGTANPVRVNAFNTQGSDKNLSNGCINVNGQTRCFDLLGKNSSMYILPEENQNILYPINKEELKGINSKNILETKKRIKESLLNSKLPVDEDRLNFLTSVAEKETKGGRSLNAKIQDYLPSFLAHSKGAFQINPESFKDYLPENYSGDFNDQVKSVNNFYDKNYKNEKGYTNPDELYQKYSGDTHGDYSDTFNKIYNTSLNAYKYGGIHQFENGGELPYSKRVEAYNDSTILYNSGFGRGIPNYVYEPQFNAAKKRLTELNKKEPQSTDYYRSYANNPNTHLQVPVLLTHPKMKVKQGERIYNNEIPTSTMGIPKDWEAEFSKPEETKKTDTYWRRK